MATMIELATCPFAGIICVECRFPISNKDDKYSFTRQIGVHEMQKHKVHSDIKERDAFVAVYHNEMESFARTLKVLWLTDEEQARTMYFKRVGVVSEYPYCSECEKLVYTTTHSSKVHVSACTKMRQGVTSKLWTNNTPKIIPIDGFSFSDPAYFSADFFKYLNDTTIGETTGTNDNNRSELKTLALQNILDKQLIQYENAKSRATVAEVQQHLTPNMWIKHTGWDKVVKSHEYSTIYQFVTETPNETEKQLLDSISCMFQHMLQAAEEIEPSHQILTEVQRRTKYQDINSRFPFYVFKQKTTWKKYFRTVKKIVLVIFRAIELQDQQRSDSFVGTSPIPKMKFTTNQLESYATIKNCILPDCPERSMLYLEFLYSLVDQTIEHNMNDVPMLASLAMMSVTDDGSFADAISTTPVLAAIIGVYKLIFIARSIKCFNVVEDDTPVSAVQEIQSHVAKHFFVNDFGNVYSPITVFVKIFQYGKQIACTATGVGTIYWEGDKVFYHDVSVTMTNFRISINGGISKLTAAVLQLCRVSNCNLLPSIPWENVIDDQTNKKVHYSFLSEEGNQEWLCLLRHRNSFNCRMADEAIDNDGAIKTKFIASYDKEVQYFLKLLLPLVHVTGGQPARGTELTNLTFVNTQYMARNISIYQGYVCFDTTYHKGYHHTGLKRIYRFLPPQVGEAIVYYLWLVLPFWQCIKGSTINAEEISPHLWSKQVAIGTPTAVSDIVGTPATGSDITEVISTEILSHGLGSLFGNHKINIRTYRHLCIAIARQYLKQKWSNDDEIDYDEFGNDADGVEVCNNILDLQAAHSTETAVRLYARGVNENRTTYQGSMEEFKECSAKLHNFIFNNPAQMVKSTTTLGHIYEQRDRQIYHKQLQTMRLQNLVTYELGTSLQQFMKNPNATFRGNQKCTIEAIVNRQPIVLQIAATGVGKTLSFMLPAFMSHGGTSIVVVPLVSLQQNMLTRCLDCGISACIWTSGTFPQPVKIMLVSPESVTSKTFLDYVNLLQDNALLDRIVLDECHLYLTCTDDFRPDMMNVCNLIKQLGVQLVMLTATLPLPCQSVLFEKLGLQEVFATILRDSTTRKNIRYEVKQIGKLHISRQVEFILNEPRFKNERVIVYVQTIIDGDTLANDFSLPFYHAKAPNKKMILDRWLAASMNRVIVATSAMGCGIDVPDIRLILHAGTPSSMIDFAQQSGRAGRDGNGSVSIILHRNRDNHKLDRDMSVYVGDETRCRRIVLDLGMDGVERQPCFPSERPCDCCQRLIGTINGGEIDNEMMEYTNQSSATATGSGSCNGGELLGIEIECIASVDFETAFNVNAVKKNRETTSLVIANGDIGSLVMDSIVHETYVPMTRSLVTPRHDILPPRSISLLGSGTGTGVGTGNGTTIGQHSSVQQKRLYVQQGLVEEQRKRSNYQDTFFDRDLFEHWLDEFPLPSGKGCLVCRVENISGKCPNRQEHWKKRTEIEKQRKRIGSKVNPMSQMFCGSAIPLYCCCNMPGCYVPQMFCKSWESDDDGGYQFKKPSVVCNHRDKLLDVIIALKGINKEASAIIDAKTDGDLSKLLTTQILWGGNKMLLLHQVFYDLCQKCMV